MNAGLPQLNKLNLVLLYLITDVLAVRLALAIGLIDVLTYKTQLDKHAFKVQISSYKIYLRLLKTVTKKMLGQAVD